jgi:hypothetical protein
MFRNILIVTGRLLISARKIMIEHCLKVINVERLGENVAASGFHRLLKIRIAVRGNSNNRSLRKTIKFSDNFRRRKAVHIRERQIH